MSPDTSVSARPMECASESCVARARTDDAEHLAAPRGVDGGSCLAAASTAFWMRGLLYDAFSTSARIGESSDA